jgi:hypothetical protein
MRFVVDKVALGQVSLLSSSFLPHRYHSKAASYPSYIIWQLGSEHVTGCSFIETVTPLCNNNSNSVVYPENVAFIWLFKKFLTVAES